MKLPNKNNISVFLDLLPLAAVLVCTIIVIAICGASQIYYDDKITDLTDGWITSDGDIVSMSSLPAGDITLTHSLADVNIDYKRLCFKTIHTNFTAAFDGTMVYEYAPERPAILGKSYGMYIHMIPIPPNESSVTLTMHPLYQGTPAEINNISVEDAGVFMGDIYHNGLPNFALCIFIALFGVLMLIMGAITWFTYENSTINFFSLGVFAILVGIWSANDTLILQVFTQRPEIVRFVNYLILIFLAYPPISFLMSATNHKNSIAKPIIISLTTVNFIATISLSLLGISDIREMLPFSHANVAIALLLAVYLMVRAAVKKTVEAQFLKRIIVSMTFVGVGVGIDLVRFQIPSVNNNMFGASFFTRVGVLIFIVIMGAHLVEERTRFAVEQGQAELMKKWRTPMVLRSLATEPLFTKKRMRYAVVVLTAILSNSILIS